MTNIKESFASAVTDLAGYLSVPEVARRRAVRKATVYRWLGLGLRHQTDILGRIVVKESDAENFVPAPTGRPTKLDYAAVVKMHQRGMSDVEIATSLGVPRTSITSIVMRKVGKRKRKKKCAKRS